MPWAKLPLCRPGKQMRSRSTGSGPGMSPLIKCKRRNIGIREGPNAISASLTFLITEIRDGEIYTVRYYVHTFPRQPHALSFELLKAPPMIAPEEPRSIGIVLLRY